MKVEEKEFTPEKGVYTVLLEQEQISQQDFRTVVAAKLRELPFVGSHRVRFGVGNAFAEIDIYPHKGKYLRRVHKKALPPRLSDMLTFKRKELNHRSTAQRRNQSYVNRPNH